MAVAFDPVDQQGEYTAQRRFLLGFAQRVRAAVPIESSRERLRQTSLEQAVVECFTCAAATGPFRGTRTSSFSDTIVRLRRLYGRVHTEDEQELSDAHEQFGVTISSPDGWLSHSNYEPWRTAHRSASVIETLNQALFA